MQAQAAVFKAGEVGCGEALLNNILRKRGRQDFHVTVTLDKVITDVVKVALIETLIESKHFNITKHGNLLDIFLTKRPVRNKRNASILLRMLYIMQESVHVEKLQENLLSYCMLLGGQGRTPRQVEWVWAFKLLDVILKFQNCQKIEHPLLKEVFADLAEEYNYKYDMGNMGIRNQLGHILRKRGIRKQETRKATQVKNPRMWMKKQEKGGEIEEESNNEKDDEDEEKIVDYEDEQQLGFWENDKVLVVGDKVQLVKPHTPVKLLGVKRFEWTDACLLELLRVYIEKAGDLMARDTGKTGRKNARAQLKQIHAKESIMVDGQDVRLDVLELDNIAKRIAYKGLSGQPEGEGLIRLLDKWLETQEEEVVDIRARVGEIVEYAKRFTCERD